MLVPSEYVQFYTKCTFHAVFNTNVEIYPASKFIIRTFIVQRKLLNLQQKIMKFSENYKLLNFQKF